MLEPDQHSLSLSLYHFSSGNKPKQEAEIQATYAGATLTVINVPPSILVAVLCLRFAFETHFYACAHTSSSLEKTTLCVV